MRCGVICVGSPFGDDAVGLLAAPLIEARLTPLGVPVACFDRPGARLVQVLEGLDSVLLVDAVKSGAAPGTLHRREGLDWTLRALARHTSTHGFGLAEAVALAQRLGRAPRHWLLFGVEIARLTPEAELSVAVAAALPRLVEAVCLEAEERCPCI